MFQHRVLPGVVNIYMYFLSYWFIQLSEFQELNSVRIILTQHSNFWTKKVKISRIIYKVSQKNYKKFHKKFTKFEQLWEPCKYQSKRNHKKLSFNNGNNVSSKNNPLASRIPQNLLVQHHQIRSTSPRQWTN